MIYRSQITKFTSYYNGKDGTSVNILGSYETYDALKAEHPTGAPGESYIIGENLYVWSETSMDWISVGRIQGPQGPEGAQGIPGTTGTRTEAVRIFAYNTSNNAPTLPGSTDIGSTLTGISPGIWTTQEITASPTYEFVFTSTGVKTTTYTGITANTSTYGEWTKPELWSAWLSDNVNVKAYAEYLKLTNNGKAEGLKYNENGNLYINATYINSGTLTVSDGTNTVFSANVGTGTVSIAGWSVDANGLTKGTLGTYNSVGIFTANASGSVTINGATYEDWRLLIGSKFGVDSYGNMICGGGYIGGWDIDKSNIHKGNVYLYSADQSTATTIQSTALKTWRIRVNTNFGITSGGALYASAGKIAGWTINSDSLTYGPAMGLAGSFHLCPGGYTPNVSLAGASSNETWVMTIGSTFGVTTGGVLYATGANISGTITALGGKIGSALDSGQLFINGSQTVAGDTSGTSGTSVCYFQKGTKESLNLTNIGYGLGVNDFFLGNGGLIMRNPNFKLGNTSSTNSSYRGFRLSSSGFYIEGSNESPIYAGKALQIFGNSVRFLLMQTSTDARATGTDTQCQAYSRLFTNTSSYRPNMGEIGNLSTYYLSTYGHGLELEGTDYIRIRTYNPSGRVAIDYGEIYFHKAATVGSDRRLKYNINVLDQKYDSFFDALLPSSYGLGDELSEIIHTGFIAQEVEAALRHAGLTNDQFAGLTPPIDETEYYSIAYTEFIALNTWQIQKLKPRMTAAEQEIEKLKLEIAQLREELENLQNS